MAAALAALLGASSAARAEPSPPEPDPGPLPGLVALVPGALLHGSGHWVAGDRGTARRLLVLSGVGLGVAAIGAAPLALSGAARRVNGPTIPLILGGAGTFTLSWIADVYGAFGGASLAGRAPAPSRWWIELGYAHVYDPQFAYDHFAVIDTSWRAGDLRLSPSAWIATDDDNQRLRLEAAHRIGRRGDGWIDVAAAATYHRYGSDDFASALGEISVTGRLDLAEVGASLRGSYAELTAGVGLELVDYRLAGVPLDVNDLLLGRFAYGFYVGELAELELSYDHRRDDFAAGLSPGANQGSGFAGHVGARARFWASPSWGLTAEVVSGAALIARVGAAWRFGDGGER